MAIPIVTLEKVTMKAEDKPDRSYYSVWNGDFLINTFPDTEEGRANAIACARNERIKNDAAIEVMSIDYFAELINF